MTALTITAISGPGKTGFFIAGRLAAGNGSRPGVF